VPAGTIYPTLLARPERTGLLLGARRGAFNQGRGLACVNLALEAEHRRVFSAHYLRHHEAHVDPRITHRFGDRVAEPRPIVALDHQGGDGRRGETRCLRRRCGLPTGNRIQLDGGFVLAPG
jgi:hypothetical protein